MLLNTHSYAQHIEAKKPKYLSLEQRNAYCRAKQEEWLVCPQKTLKFPNSFLGSFYKQNLGLGLQGI